MENFIIIAVLAVVMVVAVRASIKHFKGEGACCGGGSSTVREVKRLDAPKLGDKEIKIEGMHCENCQIRVERAVNRIDGAACRVDLKKKLAVVSYSKPVADEALRQAIEPLGFEVVAITDM